MEVFREFKFDAAHLLPNLAPGHSCSRIHGHTFRVMVMLEGEVGEESGWVRDFGNIKVLCGPVIEELDHSFLNDVPGLENPTSENIAVWIWDRLKPRLPELSMVEVSETSATGCRYRGE
jgi:6-pyruvoyltetrahydropterin/6-carboxytetrahydropterin synthase